MHFGGLMRRWLFDEQLVTESRVGSWKSEWETYCDLWHLNQNKNDNQLVSNSVNPFLDNHISGGSQMLKFSGRRRRSRKCDWLKSIDFKGIRWEHVGREEFLHEESWSSISGDSCWCPYASITIVIHSSGTTVVSAELVSYSRSLSAQWIFRFQIWKLSLQNSSILYIPLQMH